MTQGPLAAMLSYADKVRPLGGNELGAEIARIGDPGDSPTTQMQLAILLSQTRVPADLARALGLLQRVIANPSPEAQPLHPLARALAARYVEQRRVEDDRDKQVQQLRDSQRRIDQLNDRIEALRAIERSFARPAATPAPAAAGAGDQRKQAHAMSTAGHSTKAS
jgi:enoyl-CoA hydratase/carnithine racemase